MTTLSRAFPDARLAFQFIANACGIFIGKNGTRILCDPWLVDGVFEGSWCHFEKLKTTLADVQDVDALYVSHLHPDHFDERHFDFDRAKPIIILDHGPNFLMKKLKAMGFSNLIAVKDGETVAFREFKITMFAPFAKHNFHDATVGNLIDSAMVIDCDGSIALNANDNTPTVESATMMRQRFGTIGVAMLNYNAAGPYPSCFDNLTIDEKKSEHRRLLERNFAHIAAVAAELRPASILPFAGAYVLGGDLSGKNDYLGTTSWDVCAGWLRQHGVVTPVVTLRETDTLNVDTGFADRPYVPIDEAKVATYISTELAKLRYPHQLEAAPDAATLLRDVETAAAGMKQRMGRFGITSSFHVVLRLFGENYLIYPHFEKIASDVRFDRTLTCSLDERLLRDILDRKAGWNNAEIGAHINFIRAPNVYEPDLHTGLQFLHL